jgi:hypothetical protein
MKEKYLVRHGGLMRCCLLSLDDAMVAAELPPKEGDIIHCAYHDDNGGMIFRNGGWEWNAPALS